MKVCPTRLILKHHSPTSNHELSIAISKALLNHQLTSIEAVFDHQFSQPSNLLVPQEDDVLQAALLRHDRLTHALQQVLREMAKMVGWLVYVRWWLV